MVAGAGQVAAVAAAGEVAVAMTGLTRAERLAVLQFQLAALARESADPALFVALLAEALRKQLGLVA